MLVILKIQNTYSSHYIFFNIHLDVSLTIGFLSVSASVTPATEQ